MIWIWIIPLAISIAWSFRLGFRKFWDDYPSHDWEDFFTSCTLGFALSLTVIAGPASWVAKIVSNRFSPEALGRVIAGESREKKLERLKEERRADQLKIEQLEAELLR